MIPINFLAASKLQAAIECLPRTCADDHNDRYLAGKGEIEMNTDIELRMAEDVIEYIREIVTARKLPPESVGRVVANVVAGLFVEADQSIHLRGQDFGECIKKVGDDIQDCLCARSSA